MDHETNTDNRIACRNKLTSHNIKKVDMIHSCLKHYTFGQDKAFIPKETVKTALNRLKQKELFSLSAISRIDELDKIGIPAFICEIESNLGIGDSCGKGVSIEQAKASALMEAIERYSCERFIKKRGPFIISSYDDLKENALDPLSLLLPLPSIYQTDEILKNLKKVPLPWIEAFSLTHNKPIFFPLHWFYLIYGTTGFASGNTIQEAILQAIGEVIERHNISRVIQGKLSTPSIDISSVDYHIAKSLINKFFDAGIELYIKDFSLGLNIPTISVLAYDSSPPTNTVRIYNAAGAHLNRDFALIRALIELAQHRAQIIYKENKHKKPGGPTYCFPCFKTLEEASYLIENKDAIPFDKISTYKHSDFKVEIEKAVSLIKQDNLEVILTNTTCSELQIPAVAVTIPGARLNRPSTKLNPYFYMAKISMDLGNHKDAVGYFEKSIEIDPQYKKIPQILCDIAICYKRLKMYQQSKEYFEKTLNLSPKLVFSKKFIGDFTEVIQLIDN
ncbi:MAG: YcaO-like family protein [Deltaproteobacteria bacterium]|nr:YcaO-like family protein [Deltaproteobacteria bacterium]